jgi:hypothetical protein
MTSCRAAFSLCVTTLTFFATSAWAEAAPENAFTVYLDRGGSMLRAADADDATRGHSELLKENGRGYVMVPQFPFGVAMWNDVLACTRSHFSGLPIVITDQRPEGGAFSTVVVAGSRTLYGDSEVFGRMNSQPGQANPYAVGFVYAHDMKRSAQNRPHELIRDNLCGAIAHEIGHALGLEHVAACTDIMRGGDAPAACVPRQFSDRDLPCLRGQCATGKSTQNSYRDLQRILERYAR